MSSEILISLGRIQTVS